MRRISLMLALFICSAVTAQTPFEFAVVQELIQGSPFVSVMRIKIVPGSPEPGRTMLEITTRAGMLMIGESSIYPDTLEDTSVGFIGMIQYETDIPIETIERVFSVIKDCMGRFPGMGITDIGLDVVSLDDMSWLAIDCPMSSVDSLLSGTLSHLDFWRQADLKELELGTAMFMTRMQYPGVPDYTPPLTLIEIPEPVQRTASPWKSLILPGWGQLEAGQGAGWINLLVEAGGIALIITGEKEAGIGVLGANHIVSFFDLF